MSPHNSGHVKAALRGVHSNGHEESGHQSNNQLYTSRKDQK